MVFKLPELKKCPFPMNIAFVRASPSDTTAKLEIVPFNIGMGPRDVLHIHRIHYFFQRTDATDGLYRCGAGVIANDLPASESDGDNSLTLPRERNDVVSFAQFVRYNPGTDTEEIVDRESVHDFGSHPICIPRSPSLVVSWDNIPGTTMVVACVLYYTKQNAVSSVILQLVKKYVLTRSNIPLHSSNSQGD